MRFIFKRKCLFSGFSGVLVDKGSPLANVELHRKFEYRDRLYEDKVVTDKDGRFTFESLWARPIIDDIDQFIVHQNITFKVETRNIDLWIGGKLSSEEFSEFGRIPEKITFDISKEITRNKKSSDVIGTICTL
ncbi:DUF6795 domain-containing protein [Oceanobacter mangrovi]|uniref:DUF6795 domain-containing protein n=1 Tax=Oceanobacter mangrovi TaxID=2862510 RepID=UPI001C8DA485|nr:DUF6795 domain-containing protein [Oceanobacter mangrovi]